MRNLNNDFLQGVRTGFHVIDVADDHVDTIGGADNVDSGIRNRNFIKRTLFYQRQLGRFTGRFGTELKYRDFHATGAEALAPRTDQSTLSVFGYELSFGRFRLQFAGRVERNDYKTAGRVPLPGHAAAADHGHDHDHDRDDEAGDEDHLEPPDPRDRQFLGVSASLGLNADLGPATAFVANLMQSHRVPALQELYNFGPHLGNFEVGNPDLDAETTLGLDLSLRHQSGRVGTDLNFYVYDIENFIFGDHTTEVVNNLRVLDIIQGDSRFVGFDARGSVRLAGQTWASLGIGYVNATLTSTNEAVPRIPPLRATLGVDIPYGAFTVKPRADVRGAAGPGVPRRDHDTRLRRPERGRVLHLAAAAHGPRAVVHRLQPHQRALPEPHVVHQGPGPRDGPRGQGGLLAALLLESAPRRGDTDPPGW